MKPPKLSGNEQRSRIRAEIMRGAMTPAVVAERLGLSVWTVLVYVRRMDDVSVIREYRGMRLSQTYLRYDGPNVGWTRSIGTTGGLVCDDNRSVVAMRGAA